ADLRAVGDLTTAGAAEASAAVMRLAPTVRGAAVDETGVDWLLTTAEASAFLSHDTPALEEAGVTVLLPRDWTTQKTSVRPQEVGAAQSELVRRRGQGVRLDAGPLRAAERFLEAFGTRTRSERRQQRGAAGPSAPDRALEQRPTAAPAAELPPPAPVPAEIEGRAPWMEMFSLILSPDAAEVDFGVTALLGGGSRGLARLMPGAEGPFPHPQPRSLQATLRPYQLDGVNWLWALDRQGLGGILADDMGLGKTMQVLALLCREREGVGDQAPDEAAGPTLLVCPMSVVGAWQREAATFAPHLRVHVHHGGGRRRDASFVTTATEKDLVITTYSLLARD